MRAISIILSVVVLAAIGFLVADRFGGAESSSAGELGFSFTEQRSEGLHPGSAEGASASAATRSVPRIIYWNSRYYSLGPHATATFWMQCPAGSRAVDGYFYANKPGVALGSSFPAKGAKVGASRKPRWNFGVLNFNASTTVRYYTGVTCMRGIRG
jgi:hypothetical protein